MFKVKITTDSREENIYIYGQKSLLNELEEHSILLNHNCRAGHCGACIATITSGSVVSQKSVYPLKNNEILLCKAIPSTDIAIVVKY